MKKYLLPLILTLVLIFGVNCFATAWDVSTATYADKYKLVSAQETEPSGVAFSSDGSKMYVLGHDTDTVYQYTLSTSWDVSTAEYAEKYKSVLAQDPTPWGLAFSSDGSKMYVVGTGKINQYTLSTPWDVSTAAYTKNRTTVFPYGIAFSSDGSKMYIARNTDDTVNQYTLSTPWDVGTATWIKNKSVGAQDIWLSDIAFSPDGTKMYTMGNITDTVYQYTLSTPWDVGTAVYAAKSKLVSAQETSPYGVAFSSDGSKMYVLGYATDTVYQYTLPVPPDPPTNVQATDGVHTDKVVITWTKPAGATGYQVYRDATPLGWLGDVAILNDTGADAPTITAGTASASDETSTEYVTLSIAGELANDGTTHTYKVKARNAVGEGEDSETDTGYRGVGALTYQWQRSAGDSDADYSNIDGATTDPYNDTGAPVNGDGRYYKCIENATGATQQTTNADRGYRLFVPKSFFFGSNI